MDQETLQRENARIEALADRPRKLVNCTGKPVVMRTADGTVTIIQHAGERWAVMPTQEERQRWQANLPHDMSGDAGCGVRYVHEDLHVSLIAVKSPEAVRDATGVIVTRDVANAMCIPDVAKFTCNHLASELHVMPPGFDSNNRYHHGMHVFVADPHDKVGTCETPVTWDGASVTGLPIYSQLRNVGLI